MNQQDEIRDLLAAWAVDAVDDVERARVERAIRDDPDLAEEARELTDTVARLAKADAEPAPVRVRAQVLDRIAATPQQPAVRESTTHRGAATRRRTSLRWRMLAAAAAVLAAVGVPTVVAVQQADRADRAEQQVVAVEEALAQPGAEIVTAEMAEGGRAVAVLGEQSALFTAEGTPDPVEGDYQLWVIVDDDATSAGVMPWLDGRLIAELSQFPDQGALAVTVEPQGGSDQPTMDPLVVLARS